METISKKTKVLAAISYVPFPPLFLIPLLGAKKDSFEEFHSKQGFVIFLAWFISWIVSLIPFIKFIAYPVFLVLIIVAVIAFAHAVLGNRWDVPVLGAYAKRLKF